MKSFNLWGSFTGIYKLQLVISVLLNNNMVNIYWEKYFPLLSFQFLIFFDGFRRENYEMEKLSNFMNVT